MQLGISLEAEKSANVRCWSMWQNKPTRSPHQTTVCDMIIEQLQEHSGADGPIAVLMHQDR
jgi:hypothetical protein